MNSSRSQPDVASNGHTEAEPSAAHTPGPWVVNGACQVLAPDPTWLPAYVADTIPGGLPRTPEREANARPIAAAPDLLEALEDCRRELYWCAKQLAARGLKGEPGDSVEQAEDKARAAIAKAVGTSEPAGSGEAVAVTQLRDEQS